MTNEEEPAGDTEEGTGTEGGNDSQSDGFCPRLEDGRAEHHMLANPDPSYAPEDVIVERHISNSVAHNVMGNIMPETQLVPKGTRYGVVLGHVLSKYLKPSLGRWIWSISRVGFEGPIEPVDIGTSVEVGFSHNAGIESENVQGDVHLCMGSV